MITRIIEATDATRFNHGKFLIGRFDEEWLIKSAIMGAAHKWPVLGSVCGWTPEHILVLDLATGEGALFKQGGFTSHDLNKHKIWVCPMFEPFLEWLYKQNLTNLHDLPAVAELGNVPTAMQGYRRTDGQG